MVRGKLSKSFDSLLTGTAYLSGFLIIFMMLSISYEVVMRYFFNAPTSWVIDFSGYTQQAIVLLGAAWVLRNGGHTRIDIILERFQGRRQSVINLFTSCLGFIASATFFWKGLEATWGAYQRGDFLYRDIEVPSALLLGFFPVAFLLLCIQFLREMYNHFRSF